MSSRPLGRAGEGLLSLPIPLSLHSHLLEQAVGVAPTIHHVEDEADVDADATSEALVEPDVAGERVPVAVEGKTDELALAVEDR